MGNSLIYRSLICLTFLKYVHLFIVFYINSKQDKLSTYYYIKIIALDILGG